MKPANAPADGVFSLHRGCLLAQDLPFATAARLLGWQTHEEQVLSPPSLRTPMLNDEWDRYWQPETPAVLLAAAA